MIQALCAAADLDPVAIAKVVAVALSISLVLAFLQSGLRNAVWSFFNFATSLFAFLCTALLTLAHFLSARYAEAIQGLSEEGHYREGQAKPWVGWFLIGPIVYFVLMITFMASDLTVAILIFEAMGLTFGGAARSSIPIPIENAMGVVFVALAVFWGIVLFDLWRVTPFSYIWNGLTDLQRRRLVVVVIICLGITVVTGLIMGVWSQAQLNGGLPGPWQTGLPWIIRGCLVALLICGTMVAGKPSGSAFAAVWVTTLLLVRAVTFLMLVLVRFLLVVLRQLIHIPLMVLGLLAFIGHRLWNWLAGFGWARRMRLGHLTTTPISAAELGGDAERPLLFQGPTEVGAAALASNKAMMRRLYEDVFPSADANLEEFFSPSVINRDIQDGTVSGVGPLNALLTDLRNAFAGLEITVEDQVAEAEKVVSRLIFAGTQHGCFRGVQGTGHFVRLSGVDSVRLRDTKIIERWGLFDAWVP